MTNQELPIQPQPYRNCDRSTIVSLSVWAWLVKLKQCARKCSALGKCWPLSKHTVHVLCICAPLSMTRAKHLINNHRGAPYIYSPIKIYSQPKKSGTHPKSSPLPNEQKQQFAYTSVSTACSIRNIIVNCSNQSNRSCQCHV